VARTGLAEYAEEIAVSAGVEFLFGCFGLSLFDESEADAVHGLFGSSHGGVIQALPKE
jgi:hypothetical protein